MRRAACAVMIVLALLAPSVLGEEVSHGTAELQELASWTDPAGQPLWLLFSPDGSQLLVLGGASPNLLRVLDIDLDILGEREVPLDVRGAGWTDSGEGVIVWGHDQGNGTDDLLFYDVPALEASDTTVPRGLVPLETIDCAGSFADDLILLVCGRDANGTSRVVVVEVHAQRVHRDHEHPGNGTVLSLENDGRNAIAVDESGALIVYSGTDWTLQGAGRSVPGRPTATDITFAAGWAVGDDQAGVSVWPDVGNDTAISIDLDRGPVQGLAWITNEFHHLLVAFPKEGGGSVIQVWRPRELTDEPGEPPFLISEVNSTVEVAMMAYVPGAPHTVAVAFQDGTLTVFDANVTLPQFIHENGEVPPNGNGNGDDDDGWGGNAVGWIGGLVILILSLVVVYFFMLARELD